MGVLIWGLGTYVFALMQSPSFYAVPIIAAYACVMGALTVSARAVRAATPAAAARWLAVASLAWGLAVGARPHYLFSLPVLALPLVILCWRGRGRVGPGPEERPAARRLLPVAGVGLALAWYNYARFGSPLDFGLRYQFASGDQPRRCSSGTRRRSAPTSRPISCGRASFRSIFPFLIPPVERIGMWPAMPLTLLALAFPLTLWDRRRRNGAWLAGGLGALAAGWIPSWAFRSSFPGGRRALPGGFFPGVRSDRPGDGRLPAGRGPGPWGPGRARAPALAPPWSGHPHQPVLALQYSPEGNAKHALARLLDQPTAAVERLLGRGLGPLQLILSLDHLEPGQRAPLVETGRGTDALFVQRLDGSHVSFGFVHLGDPELTGPPVSFTPGSQHVVVADLGSLYPPDDHPALSGWSQALRDALHRRVAVTLDGRIALHGVSAFYPSDPLRTYVGRDVGHGIVAAQFPGGIVRGLRLGLPTREAVEDEGWTGPVRLHLLFPPFAHVISEPLVSSGRRGAAELIYVTYLAPGHLRFGHDSNGAGAIETPDLAFDPGVEHTLDIELASLEAPRAAAPGRRHSLQLRFDGTWVLSADRPTHPSDPYEVAFGYNAMQLSTARDSFSGTVLRPEHIAPLATEPAVGGVGPLELVLQFPPPIPGTREPLLVTGVAGAGDFIYVIYEGSRQIRLGVDHWGVGGVVSAPFDAPPICTFVITSAALLPGADDPAWGRVPPDERRRMAGTIQVRLNGKTVLDAPYSAYPAQPGQIAVGRNPLGGSSCGPTFGGEILETRRLGAAAVEK